MESSIKEGSRVFLMAAVPLTIVELQNGGEFNLAVIALAGAIAVLRFVDKWLHESGTAEKGLVRF